MDGIEQVPVPGKPLTRSTTHFTPIAELAEPLLLDAKIHKYTHQFADIYYSRLKILREALVGVARSKWANIPNQPKHVARLLDVNKGELSYVVGTVYIEMPLKPNILEDIGKDESIAAPPPRPKYCGPDDMMTLEDESGRIKLVGERLQNAGLVTGVIISALGMENAAGEFEVLDFCISGLAPQTPLKASSEGEGEWVGFISGLDIGLSKLASTPTDEDVLLQLLVEYLSAEAGGIEDQSMTSQVSRLILVGNSVIPIVLEDEETTKAKTMMPSRTKYDSSPIEDLTTLVTDICYAIPLHLISGPNDPTGASMPQQPLPRAMFGKELSQLPVERFACESNPAWIGVGDCEILATSGQTLDDICKYVEHEDRLALARSTLLWRHVAPTAPDTLWCYPFIQSDPFILTRSPHIYVIGNQPEFATDVVEGENGERTRIILLPRFSQTGTLVLVNTVTLEVKPITLEIFGA